MISKAQLVDRVTEDTHGTQGDPLSREEVEQVISATLVALSDAGVEGLPADDSMGTEDDLGTV